MALQKSTAIRDLQADAIIDTIPAGALVRIYTGAAPANCAAAASGTLLAELALPNPVGTKSGQVITFGTITGDASADATGTAGHWRVVNSAGTTCYLQGTCGTSGADMNLNTTSITAGVAVDITSWTITIGGA